MRLILHDGLRSAGEPVIKTTITESGKSADVLLTWPVALDQGQRRMALSVGICSAADGLLVAKTSKTVDIGAGQATVETAVSLPSPQLWNTWDRGGPAMYLADLELRDGNNVKLMRSIPFGIRSIELRRTADETRSDSL